MIIAGGLGGTSYLSADWVLQRRPGDAADHQLAIRKVLQDTGEASPLLAGTAFHGPLWAQTNEGFREAQPGQEPDWVWSCQRRLRGQAVATEDLSDEQIVHYLERALPDVAQQLQAIANLDTSPLAEVRPHQGIMVQIAEPDWVAYLFKRSYPEHSELLDRCGDEPRSTIILGHGDPLLRNIVFGAEHCWLVDWEGLYPLPADRDWTHLLAQLAIWTSPEALQVCVEMVWQAAQPALGEFSAEDFRRAAAWHILRELSMWRGRRGHQAQRMLAAANLLS